MEVGAVLDLQPCSWVGSEAKGRRSSGGSWRFQDPYREERRSSMVRFCNRRDNRASVRSGHVELKVSCCYKKPQVPDSLFPSFSSEIELDDIIVDEATETSNESDGDHSKRTMWTIADDKLLAAAYTIMNEDSVVDHFSQRGTETYHKSIDEALLLKRKSEEVLPYLNERCIYLVGMMGSGKTTIGKILSEVLRYSFFDSDKLVEQTVGVSSVAQIFKQYSEAFFRDNESEVLKDLSSMSRLVVATGGGAVIRPINWKFMKHGISVWLDVPLEALARRIADVGTDSRPLLHYEPGDPYSKALAKLTSLFEERGEAYANADARVSLGGKPSCSCYASCFLFVAGFVLEMAAKKGHGDVSTLTPTDIAFEALLQIENYVMDNAYASSSRNNFTGARRD
ncbi:hypothetical protein ZIOFF_057974 [Zingiber officinale]|uniref:shikimate kinase n=1 Tax=Zingiber officinale TaxID=94328 RepID=A0A8J5FD85_ZINOF|nr:hypothetical protein ZIOFF_057974 [Zingiber officinale]